MSPVRRGSSFMLVACGLLAGLLVANLADEDGGTSLSSGSSPTGVDGDEGPGTDSDAASDDLAAPGEEGTGDDSPNGSTSDTGTRPGSSPGTQDGSSPAPGSTGGATDVGVSATKVKLGLVALGTAALKALGPTYDVGDTKAMWRALVEEARADGRLPVNGRDIDPYIISSEFDLSPNAAGNRRAECVEMTQDAKVFAVIGSQQFDTRCIAGEFKTPLVGLLNPGFERDARAVPMAFNTVVSYEKGFRNAAAWMIESGVLKGHTLGFYYTEDDQGRGASYKEYKPNLLDPLAAAGYKMTKEVRYDQAEMGRESTHALQFRTAGVDLIISANGLNLASGPSFMNAAEGMGYHPKYVLATVDDGATYEPVSQNFPADHFDGTPALVDDARGLENGPQGMAALTPAARKCVDTFNRRTEMRLDPKRTSTAWSVYLTACDSLNMVIEGLRATGPNLTRTRFVDALARVEIQTNNLAWFATGNFGADRSWAQELRVIQFSKTCACWRPAGPFRPFWVP